MKHIYGCKIYAQLLTVGILMILTMDKWTSVRAQGLVQRQFIAVMKDSLWWAMIVAGVKLVENGPGKPQSVNVRSTNSTYSS